MAARRQQPTGPGQMLDRAEDVGRQGLARGVEQEGQGAGGDADPVDWRAVGVRDAQPGRRHHRAERGAEEQQIERRVDDRAQARLHPRGHRVVQEAVAHHHAEHAKEGQSCDEQALQKVEVEHHAGAAPIVRAVLDEVVQGHGVVVHARRLALHGRMTQSLEARNCPPTMTIFPASRRCRSRALQPKPATSRSYPSVSAYGHSCLAPAPGPRRPAELLAQSC